MFVPRTRDQIRDSISSNWRARYAANGRVLNTARGSEAYMLADALAVELENLEASAAVMTLGILPDQADTDTLNRHGAVDGVTRKVATAAVLLVTIAGANGNYALTGRSFTSPDGQTFNVTYSVGAGSPTTISGGTGSVYVVCAATGESGTLAPGTVVTWVSATAGLDPTGTVASTYAAGLDAENDSDYATRIIRRRQNRPASGNRADWQDWVVGFDGVTEAYVYPLLQPPAVFPGAGTPETLGCVTVLALGPAQGDRVDNTRIVGGLAGYPLNTIRQYIEGLAASDGTAITDGTGTQLRPVTMSVDDYSIEAANVVAQDVEATLVLNAANAFPWSGSIAIISSTTSTIVVAGDYSSSGTDLTGLDFLANIGTANYRGGYKKFRFPTGVFSAGNTTWTFPTLFAGAPTGSLFPAPACWQLLRLAAFRYFDALGPGDVSPAARWPGEDIASRATFYRSALAAALLTVPGVLSATIVTPGTNLVPTGKTIVTLDTFLVTA